MSHADDLAVRASVLAFYQAFDDGFVDEVDFATEDWYHINPFGGINKGMEATLREVREVHATFLKGASDSPFDIDIRYPSDEVAVATMQSTLSPFTGPNGARYEPSAQVRTFVLVRRAARWLIMQDHNTFVAAVSPA